MLVRKKLEARKRFKAAFVILLFVLAAGGVVYGIFYSPLFRVKSIEVKGAQITYDQIMKGKYANMLFALPKIDISGIPELSGFKVNKDYWNHKVTIEVKERDRAMIWCLEQSGQCFWIDHNGFIFSSAPEPSGGEVIKVVQDSSGRDLKVGDYVLRSDEFVNLYSGLNTIDALNLSISKVSMENIKFEEFTVFITDGPKLYLSLLFDPSEDSDAIKTLSQSKDWNKFCYVDLRTELRIYTSKTCSN